MNVVILGPPGSGKGTQARIIGGLYSLAVVDTGRLLRVSLASNMEMIRHINAGNLLSDAVVVKIVKDYLLSLNNDFILDGFPRTLDQAKALIDFFTETKKSLDCVIKMVIDDDLVISRLATRFICSDCGAIFNCFVKECSECNSVKVEKRIDDENISAVKQRILKYKEEMSPLETFLRSQNCHFISIEASRPVDEVTKDIQNNLI